MHLKESMVTCLMIVSLGTTAFGATPTYEPPTTPSAPPALTKHAPKDAFTCGRYYSYHGKILSCDSQLHRDGEGLRPVIQSVPSAVDELNAYQKTRKSLQTSAYVGTIGMLLFVQSYIAGGLIGNVFLTGIGAEVPRLVRAGGAMIALGGAGYGLSVLHSNERHLDNAVHYYNDVHPDNPIELKISAEF